jgi:hypothetical protein
MARPEDFRDDFDKPRSDRADHGSSVGLIGFISALVSIALIVVIFVLWQLLKQEQQAQQDPNPNRERLMALWFLILNALSLVFSVVAVILGIRGMAPRNQLYRGYSITAMVAGSFELIATLFFGCFLSCFAAFFAGRN